MRRKHVVCQAGLALLFLLATCGGPGAAPGPPQVVQTVQPKPTAPPTTSPLPRPSPARTAAPSPVPAATPAPTPPGGWAQYIGAGNAFLVVLDETRDSGTSSDYVGDWRADPLGALKGGETYTVRFSSASGWVTTGYNQAAREVISSANATRCATPGARQLCLWGSGFTFDDQGQVFYSSYGLAGHLRMGRPPQDLPAVPPAVPVSADVEAALWDYTRLRKEAEETLNPDLLAQVCVDPYLTWKTERIKENIASGSHWETPSAIFTVITFTQPTSDTAVVWVRKTETKLYYPKSSAKPDDEICSGAIYSYRDCTYRIEYQLVRKEERWYIADVQALDDCLSECHSRQ